MRSVGEAIPEELVFRGYIFTVLHERLRDWATILVQTVHFAGVPLLLRGYTGVVDLSLFIGMGIALGYLRLVTGTVWTSVGFHTAFQTGSQLVLSHEVVEFSGSQQLAMLAVGVVPFALGVAAVGALAPKYRRWFKVGGTIGVELLRIRNGEEVRRTAGLAPGWWTQGYAAC